MKVFKKKLIKIVINFSEIFCLPFLLVSGSIMYIYRRIGSQRLNLSTRALKALGVFPIRDHYYEPLFNHKNLSRNLKETRYLPGIDFNENSQIKFLEKLNYQREFRDFVENEERKKNKNAFKLRNGYFESGDADFLFNFVRYIKPNRVIEVGCGRSTKIIQHAIILNEKEQSSRASHVCVEPYEQPWLKDFPHIELVRDKVELINLKIFDELKDGDFLFIDSSHIANPRGDVLHEYLTIIPNLKKGIYVHAHDIFTPYDYPEDWVKKNVLFWNEQYILEALLTGNQGLEIIAALNFLKHKYYSELNRVCTYLTQDREPGSFYFRIK